MEYFITWYMDILYYAVMEVFLMEMIVHLDEDIFDIVQYGKKDVEARLNDEKRRKLRIGDTLVFLKRPLEKEKIVTTVVGLEYYDSFQELVQHYDIERLYLKGYTKEMYLKELERFYSSQEQKENGVVAILFRKESL